MLSDYLIKLNRPNLKNHMHLEKYQTSFWKGDFVALEVHYIDFSHLLKTLTLLQL